MSLVGETEEFMLSKEEEPRSDVDVRIHHFFVCIGAQKAGTTWLARVLASNTSVFMTPVKEIHYFDHIGGLTNQLVDRKRKSRHRKYWQKLLTQLHRFPSLHRQRAWYRAYMGNPIDDRWYASLFRERDGKRFAGEVTPEYAIIGRQGFEHMRRLAPEARVLFILRDPVMRAWSHMLHYCRTTDRNATRLSVPELIAVVKQAPNFEALGDYATTISNLRQAFPAEQIQIMFYEDIHNDRASALRDVCKFIGIPFDVSAVPLARRFNRSQDAALPEGMRAYLRQRYREQVIAVRERVGRIPESWESEFCL